MLKVSKSISVTGSSVVSVNGEDKVVMTMNANIREDGSVNASSYIQDRDLYRTYKTDVRKDENEFDDYVDTLLEA